MTAETEAVPSLRLKAGKYYTYNEKRPRNEFKWSVAMHLVAIHLGALAGILYYPVTGQWPSLKVVILFVVMGVFSGLGITGGYHRLFTHGGYETSRWFKAVLLCTGALALEGGAKWWVITHWFHHDRSDRPGDPHSPFQYPGIKGILWAHIGWMLYKTHLPPELPDKRQWILNDPLFKYQNKFYWVFLVATFGIPFWIAGLEGLLVAGFLRVAFFLHFTWSINSVCHVWGKQVAVKYVTKAELAKWNAAKAEAEAAGVECTYEPEYRVKRGGDGSRNNWFIALFSFGEGYHGLHHLFDWVAYHCWGKGADLTKGVLILLERSGIVWDVKKPPEDAVVTEDDLALPDDSLMHRREVTLAA